MDILCLKNFDEMAVLLSFLLEDHFLFNLVFKLLFDVFYALLDLHFLLFLIKFCLLQLFFLSVDCDLELLLFVLCLVVVM